VAWATRRQTVASVRSLARPGGCVASVRVDGVLVVTQIFSMLAAFAAVVFAYATVRESQALRREERVARLLDLLVDIAAAGARIQTDQPGGVEAQWVAQARLRAGLRAVGEPLPACERVLSVHWLTIGHHPHALEGNADALNAVSRALDEVAALLERLRGEGSTVTP
jgi:hypothetical protein